MRASLLTLLPFVVLAVATPVPKLEGIYHTGPQPLAPATTVHEEPIDASNITAPYPVNKGYVSDGELHSPPPKPFQPAGGLALNETPIYHPLSDFDFQSLNLALYTEWLELDLFRYAIAEFSEEEFEEA